MSEAILKPLVHEARLIAHWASQLPSIAGSAYLPELVDDSQSNLGWDPKQQVMRAELHSNVASSLRLGDFTLLVEQGAGTPVAELPLAGQTLEAAIAWLSEQLAERIGKPHQALKLRDYEMPSHAVQGGAPFSALQDGQGDVLATWFDAAARAFDTLIEDESQVTDARIWPHHFDLGLLVYCDVPDERAVGVGFEPGDGTYPDPYFYVNPYPQPRGAALPELSSGASWHTDGWIGAILPATALLALPDRATQDDTIDQYLTTSVAACRALING